VTLSPAIEIVPLRSGPEFIVARKLIRSSPSPLGAEVTDSQEASLVAVQLQPLAVEMLTLPSWLLQPSVCCSGETE
jgi:hypothetical protein